MKLAKFVIGSVSFLVFLYVAFFVPLGAKTLYQHVRGISKTQEAKELGEGIKTKAVDVKDGVVEKIPELNELNHRVGAIKSAAKSIPEKSDPLEKFQKPSKEKKESGRASCRERVCHRV